MFKAIWKFFSNLVGIKTDQVNKAANELYTNSSEGIRAGYQQARDQIVKNTNDLISGISDLETLLIQKKAKLKELEKEEIEVDNVIEGILSMLEKNSEDTQAISDYELMSTKANKIDENQELLEIEVENLQVKMGEYDLQLKKMKDQIHELKEEEAESVSDHALMSIEEQLLQKEAGFTTSADMSAVQAIREARAKRKAKVSTLNRVSGANTNKRMDKYKTFGQNSKANEELNEILAARKAKKQASNAGGTSIEKDEANKQREV